MRGKAECRVRQIAELLHRAPAAPAGSRRRKPENRMPQPRSRPPIWFVAAFYLPMLASGAFAKTPGSLRVQHWPLLAYGLGAALSAGLAIVALSRIAGGQWAWARALREEFRAVLGPLGSEEILVLSLLSAFGEELLFRGVLHPRLGLWLTALLFGLLHFPYRRALLPWTAFALALGIGLGAMTDFFQSLWPAISLHFIVNYFNLHDLMRSSLSDGPADPAAQREPGEPAEPDEPREP